MFQRSEAFSMFTHVPIDLGYDNLPTKTINGKRHYIINGEPYASITTVLSDNEKKKASLAEWRKRVGHEKASRISTQAASRGTSVHSVCEKYVDNDSTYLDGVMPPVKAMFSTLKPILDTKLDNIYAQELALYSDTLKIAGRVDCIGEWENQLATVDYKTSSKPKREEWISDYYKQLAGYTAMFYERTNIVIKKGVVLIAVENDSPQTFVINPWDWIKPLHEDVNKYHAKSTL